MMPKIEEIEEALEIVFEHLDVSKWEDSYVDAVGYGDPNEMFKETVEDKKQYLYDILSDAIQELNMRRCNDR